MRLLKPCGSWGIRTPGTVNPYVSLANWWFQPLTQTSFSVDVENRFAVKCGAKVLLFFSSSKFFRAFLFQMACKKCLYCFLRGNWGRMVRWCGWFGAWLLAPLIFSNWFVQLGMAAGYNLLLWRWCEWVNGVGCWLSCDAGRGVETLWSFFLSRTRASCKVCFCGGNVIVACLGNVDW